MVFTLNFDKCVWNATSLFRRVAEWLDVRLKTETSRCNQRLPPTQSIRGAFKAHVCMHVCVCVCVRVSALAQWAKAIKAYKLTKQN